MSIYFKNLILIILILISLFLVNVNSSASEIDFSGKIEGPFKTQENFFQSNNSLIFQENTSGLSYTPFQSQGLNNPPVLYGPGGDPIGGLPVGDGVYVLFFAVLIYCVYKTFCKVHSIKSMKKKS